MHAMTTAQYDDLTIDLVKSLAAVLHDTMGQNAALTATQSQSVLLAIADAIQSEVVPNDMDDVQDLAFMAVLLSAPRKVQDAFHVLASAAQGTRAR